MHARLFLGIPKTGTVVHNFTSMISVHIDTETLDHFCLGWLRDEDTIERIEEHLLGCAECQDALEGTIHLIAALRAFDGVLSRAASVLRAKSTCSSCAPYCRLVTSRNSGRN